MRSLLLGCLLLSSCSVVAAPHARLSPRETAQLTSFDYADWSAVLAGFVNERGRVDYAALAKDRARLDRFVAVLAHVGPKTRPDLFPSSAHRLAYYINAYNALTMFNVVIRLPKLKSVHDERLSFFVLTKLKLDGDEINLYDLENKVVRPTFREPRVHFALNCASVGCPTLPNEPFLPERLEEQLARETTRFLHERRNVDVVDGKVTLSSLFDWYEEDFAEDPVAWIRRAAPDLALPQTKEYDVRDYDWRLNDQALERKTP